MKNSLPPFKTFQIDGLKDKKAEAERSWRPTDSDPNTAQFPFGISKEFSEERKIEWRTTDKYALAPNKKYFEKLYDEKEDPSPLGESQRGEKAPDVKISLPEPERQINFGSRKETSRTDYGPIVVNISSTLRSPFDVFIRTETQMQTLLLDPYRSLSCSFVSSAKTSNDLFSILVAPLKNFAILMNDRQEIKEYSFMPGPIGLEIEERNNALIITGVVADSQASPHELYIGGLEVIAVNGERVTSLSHFQDVVIRAMQLAQSDPSGYGVVRLAIISYKVPKQKLDELYNWGGAKDSKVKGLFGSLVKHGIDKDHSHGIELPKSREDSSSDDEENEEEEEEEEDNGEDAKDKSADAGDKNDDSFDSSINNYKGDKTSDFKNTDWNDSKEVASTEPVSDTKTYLTDIDDGSSEMLAPRVVRASVIVDADKNNNKNGGGGTNNIKKKKKKKKADYDSDDEEEGKKSKQSWEYTTALENLELAPYFSIVCLPSFMSKSFDWGRPSDVIAFGNFSRKLCVSIFWVDEDGSLVLRKKMNPGEKHLDFVSSDHVWVISASNAIAENRSIYSNSKILRSSTGSPSKENKEIVPNDSTCMLFRVSKTTLASPMSFVAIWTPLCSLSFSQRAITLPKGSSKSWQERIKERTDMACGIPPKIDTSSDGEPVPKLNFQIFEPNKSI